MSYSEIVTFGNVSYKCDHCIFATPILQRAISHNKTHQRVVLTDSTILDENGRPMTSESEVAINVENPNIVEADHLGT
jgi:hypothetical protein